MENTEKKFLDDKGLTKVIELLKTIYYTKKEVDEFLKDTGGSGGSFDATELKQWVENNYAKKNGSSDALIQADGAFRDIFDSTSFTDGVNTDIPTVRAIKHVLSDYLKSDDIDLGEYEKTSDLLSKLTNLKSEILGGAGEDYDTLKEIEEWVREHEDIYEALVSTVSQKATKEEIKDMATQTYVNEEFEKVTEELGKKCNVVVCDSQYEFDQILTKDNNAIYLIKGDQDVWAAKDYVDELFDMMVDLRSRVTRLEADNYGAPNEEEVSEA